MPNVFKSDISPNFKYDKIAYSAVHTHASSRGHHLTPRDSFSSDAAFQPAPRHFSDPDASWGWDSDFEKYFYGYTLFQFSCYHSELYNEVPLLLRFTSARRHDSVSFPAAFHELEKHMPALSIENMCLDSAMDNLPAYTLLRKRSIRAFIDLNNKCGHPKTIHGNISVNQYGTPICSAGKCMVPNGYDKSRDCMMWRCRYGKDHAAKCSQNCSSSKYGRVIKTKPEWGIRLYTDVPRGTDAYKDIYKQRTATERINNRILNDYGLHRLNIHKKNIVLVYEMDSYRTKYHMA